MKKIIEIASREAWYPFKYIIKDIKSFSSV